MVRVILAAMLVGCGVVVAPVAAALPESCPPVCDRIPDTAWPQSASLPLNATLHWPPLAGRAAPVLRPRFYTEELCSIPLPADDPRTYAVAAKAEVPAPPGQWQMRAQIIHWRGETSHGGQLATTAFEQARAALRACPVVMPALSPSVTTDRDGGLAAVITGPQIVHQYLVAHPQSSTIAELVFWATPPPLGALAVPWSAPPDGQVLAAVTEALCAAYLSSCG
jgi:hypothetical protein